MPEMAKRVHIYHDGISIDGVELPWYVKEGSLVSQHGSGIIELEMTLFIDEELYWHDRSMPEADKRKTGRRCRVWG